VVDDGSPEAIGGVVQQFAKSSHVAVKCLRTSRAGPAAARVRGADQARGELLVFVDDDMLIGANFLREHIAAHREAGPAGVNCLFDWRVQAWPRPFQAWYGHRVRQWAASRRAAMSPIGNGLFEIQNVLLTTANISVARTDYERVGGFDTGYVFSCEDQDFGLRLAAAGVRGVVTTRTEATHVETHNTLRSVCRRQAAGARDAVRFMRRFSLLDRADQAWLVMVNDPIRMSVDPWAIVVKKMLKSLIASDVASPLVFAFMALWGRVPVRLSRLERTYDLVVGAHLRKGWCQGRRTHGPEVVPLHLEGKTRVA
jgi:GT2 family glycosyltransferase